MITNMDDKGAARTTAQDHLRSMLDLMRQGARINLSGIPDDPTFLSSNIPGEIAKEIAALIQSPADAGVVTEEMVRRATDAFWSKEVRETENQTLRMRVALKAALSTKPEAGSGDYVRGLQRAAEIAMEENERRIALASIRVPAMAVEIRDAILKEAATQPPTPASGEQMEVERFDEFWDGWGDEYRGMRQHAAGKWVKYDDHAKAITAANERAERAERERDTEIAALQIRLRDWRNAHRLEMGGRAAAEALNTTLSEALEWYGEQARLCRMISKDGDSGRDALARDGGKRALAALPAKQGELSDEA